jgi:transposase InsO family protein
MAPSVPPSIARKVRNDGQRYTYPQRYEIKRKAVKLYLEEGLPAELVAKELGVWKGTIFDWVRQYREQGEEGLRPKGHYNSRSVNKLPPAVKEKIAALKRENPRHGGKRLSQILRRIFFIKASPGTVRRELKKAGLATPKAKARKPREQPERRFERSTPNQMWQSDITYFSILGKMAYIIGFIDDHSRYITALGVYRSHTSEYVVETYRNAVAEYGAPKEMLTDNGRQYASWRGKTKFQKELEKDHVHHIRSAPQHPMTLGKIERFWQTLKEEFLERARFETFEEARERLAYWVKYYNHKRTHQGLDGMCPADRFFSIQKELKETIERGVASNIEELALRGKPVEPFYMVGRMGDKSVVIETDKKRMSVLVDGKEVGAGQGMVYDLKEGKAHEAGTGDSGRREETARESVQREGKEPGGTGAMERAAERRQPDEGTGGGVGRAEQLGEAGAVRDDDGVGPDVEAAGGGAGGPAPEGGTTHGTDSEPGAGSAGGELRRKDVSHEDNGSGSVRGGGEVPGGAGGVDGAEAGVGPVPGAGDKAVAVLAVAGPGGIGYVGGVGAAGNEGRGGGAGAAGPGETPAGSQGAPPGVARMAAPSSEGEAAGGGGLARRGLLSEEVKGVDRGTGSERGRAAAGDPGSPGGEAHGDRGGSGSGGEPEDLLRVAGPGQGSDAHGADGSARGASAEAGGPGEGTAPGGAFYRGEGAAGAGKPAADPGGDPGDIGGAGRRVVAG